MKRHPLQNRALMAAVFLGAVAAFAAPFVYHSANAPAANGPAADLQNAFIQVAERAEPAVVSITAERATSATREIPDIFRNFPFDFGPQPRPDRPRTRTVGGSGVIVRSNGYILTNDHVVGGAEKVTVTLHDGREFEGEVTRDYATDLAVIKIDANNLPSLSLTDSSELKPGAWAIAIGSPFGLENTLTVGVISALERETFIPDGTGGQGRYYASLIQTDASINPGNSGGPLLDLDGNIIGINVAIESPTGANVGLGFAIPANTAEYVLEQLIESGKVVRGYMGVLPRNLTPAMREDYGVDSGAFIAQVTEGTPAAEAGVQVEDVVVEIDGKPIDDALALREAVARTKPGSQVNVVVIRNQQRQTLRLSVGTPPGEMTGDTTPVQSEELGMRVTALTQQMREQLDLPSTVQGVVVTEVSPNGAAARGGIATNDVIQRINGKDIVNVQQYREAMGAINSGDTARIVIRRGDSRSLVQLQMP